MSDKGRKQEDRSGGLKAPHGSSGGIPPMGTTPTLVHHHTPTYTLHNEASHLHIHPSHPLAAAAAYGIMRPSMVAPSLSMTPGKPRSAVAFSNVNDLGPPIFMPSLNLGVPKQSSASPTYSGTVSKPKNSVSQPMTLMSEMLSNPPAPFQHLPGYHAHSPSLRPPQASMPPYITAGAPSTHVQVHLPVSGNAVNMTSKPVPVTQGGMVLSNTPIPKPVPIPPLNPKGFGKGTPKIVPTSQPRSSSSSASSQHSHSVPPPPVPVSQPWRSMSDPSPSVSKAALSSHMHSGGAKGPPSSLPLGAQEAGSSSLESLNLAADHPLGGSTLTKMLSTPSGAGRMQSMVGESSAGKASTPTGTDSQKTAGTPDAFAAKGLPRVAPSSHTTSGQPSSAAVSPADTRLDHPPQPSASALNQPPTVVGGGARDRGGNTTAEIASNLIIVQGLTGKHISQITNNSSVQQSTAGYTSSGSSLSGMGTTSGSEHYQSMAKRDQSDTEDVALGYSDSEVSLHHLMQMGPPCDPSINAGGRVLQSVSGPGAKLPQAAHIPVGGPALSAGAPPSMIGNGQSAGGLGSPLSQTLSPGQASSSPRPRILRKRPLEGNRIMDGSSSPSSSPLMSRLPVGLTRQTSSGTDPLSLSASSLRVPLSPTSEPTPNHLGAARLDGSDFMASPRKKPRKQNVVVTDDQYASNVPDGIVCDSSSPTPSLPHSSPTNDEEQPVMVTPSHVKEEEEEGVEAGTAETPKQVEVCYLAQLRRSPYPINGMYGAQHKAAHNHFRRYSDIKHREDERVTVYDIAADKSSWKRASGWKLHRFGSQLDDVVSVESNILQTMCRLQESIRGKRLSVPEEDEEVLEQYIELIEGNKDRSRRVISHLTDAKTNMSKVLKHRPQVLDFLRKFSSESSDSSFALNLAVHKSHS